MPSCCIANCKTRNRLFRFPSNPDRRNIWITNCLEFTKPNWKPPTNVTICESHFDENQFEQNRLDKRKKLKPCAVPTLFSIAVNRNKVTKRHKHKGESSRIETRTENLDAVKSTSNLSKSDGDGIKDLERNKVTQNGKLIISTGTSQIVLECDIIFHGNQNKKETLNSNNIDKTSHKEDDNNKTKDNNSVDYELSDAKSNMKEESSVEREVRYMCNIKQLEKENRQLKKTIQSVEKFLHKEQLEHLTKANTNEIIHKWSKECILSCLKLKSVLGWDGYNYLLSLGYPGPVKSTLCRYLQQYQGELQSCLPEADKIDAT